MQQITLDYFKPHYSINQPVRLIELFAGIGSQAKALQKLGVDFEKWVISEWEVNATKSYKAIHCENDNTDYSKGINQKELINALFSMGISNDGKEPMTLQQIARKNEKWLRETYNVYKATHNISNLMRAAGKDLNIVDVEKYVYILTYSFPCQDLSIAGKQAGMTKGSKTRSGLLWEVERLLKECENLPQVLLMENVTQVHNKKNFADFKKWVECLEDLGYSNYYADLNAKDYGVPQNRNRTFMISILGDYYYQFPEPFKLQKRLKDILETNVDEKYYLSSTVLKGFEKHNARHIAKGTGFLWKPKTENDIACCIRSNSALAPTDNTIIDEIIGSTQKNAYRGSLDGPCPTLTTAMGEGGGNIPMIKQVAQLYPNSGNPQNGRVISSDGISYSLKTPQGGNSQPMIIEVGDSININYPTSETRKGRYMKNMAHNVGCQNNSQVVVVDDTYKGRKERKYDDVCPEIRSGRSGFKVCSPKHNNRIVESIYNKSGKWQNLSDRIYTTIITSRFFIPYYPLIYSTIRHKVRKLTPKECLRLMTFDDADYEKIKAAGISDSAIYKQAGNSIVVNVMVFIFAMLFDIKVNFYEV